MIAALIAPEVAHAQAALECSCLHSSMVVTGGTACTAVETPDRCMVSFNHLGDVVEALSSSEREGHLLEAVTAYLLVSAAGHAFAVGGGPGQGLRAAMDDVVRILTRDEELSASVALAFSSHTRDRWITIVDGGLPITVPIFRSAGVVLLPGCIEVTVQDVWLMFKVPWSPARTSPQCTD